MKDFKSNNNRFNSNNSRNFNRKPRFEKSSDFGRSNNFDRPVRSERRSEDGFDPNRSSFSYGERAERSDRTERPRFENSRFSPRNNSRPSNFRSERPRFENRFEGRFENKSENRSENRSENNSENGFERSNFRTERRFSNNGGGRRFGNSGGGSRFGGRRFGNGGGLKRRIVWSPSELVRMVEDAKVKIKNSQVKEEKVIITHSFADFNFDANLYKNVLELGYVTPTPIQDKSIPLIMKGHDIVGLANTGTGKTATFLLPLIDKHLKDKTQKVLIVTPTRELAEQINKEFLKFTKGMRIGTSLCIGGTSIFRQIKELKYKPNFIIGTPGRLKDLINREILDLKDFKNVVLDEADQMLEIGFVEEVKFLVSKLAKDRQSLFFSATTNKKVNEILSSFVKDPITVSVLRENINLNVAQDYLRVPQGKRKSEVLFEFLSGSEYQKVIVFGQTKNGVEDLAVHLSKKGLLVESIHGDKRQNQRKASLMRFKANEIKILIATDVVSRGIDISDVSHVINYDLPRSQDEYIHRIGRTGRAGKKGLALTLID